MLGEMRRRADAGEHQQLRGVDRGGREDDLAAGPDGLAARGADDLDAGGAALRDDDAGGEAGDDGDVAAGDRGAQVGVGGGPAAAAPDRLLHRAEALLLLAVVVVGELEAGLGAGLDEGVVERVAARAAGDVQRAVVAAPVGGAAVPVLHALEVGEDVGEGPAVGARLGPVVEVLRMAADVDHAVDRGGAAEHLAARGGEAAAAEVRLGLGAEAPVVAGHVHRVGERRRHLDERAPVGAAVLDDRDRVAGLGEPVGDGGAGGAGADDDVVGLHQSG